MVSMSPRSGDQMPRIKRGCATGRSARPPTRSIRGRRRLSREEGPMPDDEITLLNTCTDLVSLRKAEAFLLHLFHSKRPGEWICVREVCQRIGVPAGDLRPEVFAT